jgi:hypothetical protein
MPLRGVLHENKRLIRRRNTPLNWNKPPNLLLSTLPRPPKSLVRLLYKDSTVAKLPKK